MRTKIIISTSLFGFPELTITPRRPFPLTTTRFEAKMLENDLALLWNSPLIKVYS